MKNHPFAWRREVSSFISDVAVNSPLVLIVCALISDLNFNQPNQRCSLVRHSFRSGVLDGPRLHTERVKLGLRSFYHNVYQGSVAGSVTMATTSTPTGCPHAALIFAISITVVVHGEQVSSLTVRQSGLFFWGREGEVVYGSFS